MFERFKKWIGVQQVKVKFNTLPVYPSNVETLNGELVLYAQDKQLIEWYTLTFTEVYTRGRGDNKRIDEYILGQQTVELSLPVVSMQPERILFKLPFSFNMSKMDHLGSKNIVSKKIAQVAKRLKGVHSDYHLLVEVGVKDQKSPTKARTKIAFDR